MLGVAAVIFRFGDLLSIHFLAFAKELADVYKDSVIHSAGVVHVETIYARWVLRILVVVERWILRVSYLTEEFLRGEFLQRQLNGRSGIHIQKEECRKSSNV